MRLIERSADSSYSIMVGTTDQLTNAIPGSNDNRVTRRINFASQMKTSGPRRPQSVLVHRFSVTYDSGIILRTAKVPSQLELVSRRSVHEKAILRQLRQESRLRTTQR